MPTFSITFTAPDKETLEASLSWLSDSYGGHRATVIDPAWRRKDGEPDEPPIIPNPESREDLIRRNVLATLTQRVIDYRASLAGDAAASAFADAARKAASTITAA